MSVPVSMSYMTRINNVQGITVGTDCSNPFSMGGQTQNWVFRLRGIPNGQTPWLIEAEIGGIWRNQTAGCSSNGNWPMNAVRDSQPDSSDPTVYGWTLYVAPYPSNVPGAGVRFTVQYGTSFPGSATYQMTAAESCQIQATTTPIIRRGPSDDDVVVPLASLLFPIGAVARAYDEVAPTPNLWYGFEHFQRLGVLSWVKASSSVTLSCSVATLPCRNTSADTNWGTGLTFARFPISDFATANTCKGFAVLSSDPPTADYSSTSNRHTGVDFFATVNQNVKVFSVSDGIVVGMGPAGQITSPALWGAAGANGSGYNLVVRTGRFFVLYGHMATITDKLYLGARVAAADLLGTLADQGTNTHLHLEVRAFAENIINSQTVRCRFGAIVANSSAKPLAIDPIRFVANKGTCSSGPCNPSLTSDTSMNLYNNASLPISGSALQTFNYKMRNSYEGDLFNVLNGAFRDYNPTETDTAWKIGVCTTFPTAGCP